MNLPPWINEELNATRLSPLEMDLLWGEGWRRFGTTLFRYSITLSESGALDVIVPLRITLAEFKASKSQRRILRRNADLTWESRPSALTPELTNLFEKHRRRFKQNVPDSLAVFLGSDPKSNPCECVEFRCLLDGRLIAASFLDIGACSVSSVYAVFDPAESRRSPGILTLLKEIEWARGHGLKFLHPGYTTAGPGVYDYKKQFRSLEGYDWSTGEWHPWRHFDDGVTAPALSRLNETVVARSDDTHDVTTRAARKTKE